jgi:hypothetical protein
MLSAERSPEDRTSQSLLREPEVPYDNTMFVREICHEIVKWTGLFY